MTLRVPWNSCSMGRPPKTSLSIRFRLMGRHPGRWGGIQFPQEEVRKTRWSTILQKCSCQPGNTVYVLRGGQQRPLNCPKCSQWLQWHFWWLQQPFPVLCLHAERGGFAGPGCSSSSCPRRAPCRAPLRVDRLRAGDRENILQGAEVCTMFISPTGRFHP